MIEDPVIDFEEGFWAAHLPNKADDTDSEVSQSIPPLITLHEPLAYIEGLLIFTLQVTLTTNITELQDVLNREKKHIETLEIHHHCEHIQCRISDFLGTSGFSFS